MWFLHTAFYIVFSESTPILHKSVLSPCIQSVCWWLDPICLPFLNWWTLAVSSPPPHPSTLGSWFTPQTSSATRIARVQRKNTREPHATITPARRSLPLWRWVCQCPALPFYPQTAAPCSSWVLLITQQCCHFYLLPFSDFSRLGCSLSKVIKKWWGIQLVSSSSIDSGEFLRPCP